MKKCHNPFCEDRTYWSRIAGMHNHHIIFKSAGGSDDDWNRIYLCAVCHEYVHGRGNPRLGFKSVSGYQYMLAILSCYAGYKAGGRWDKVFLILVERNC